MTIEGHGATITRSTAGSTPDFRLIAVASVASLSLDQLILSHGSNAVSVGGGILNNGTLTVTNSTLCITPQSLTAVPFQRRLGDADRQHPVQQLSWV